MIVLKTKIRKEKSTLKVKIIHNKFSKVGSQTETEHWGMCSNKKNTENLLSFYMYSHSYLPDPRIREIGVKRIRMYSKQ